VAAGADASRQLPSKLASPARTSTGTYNLFTLSASVSYTLDIFGGERRQVEALTAGVDFQKNAARAASLTLAANIANTMIAIAAYDAEIAAENDIIAMDRKQAQLAGVQAVAGTGTYAAQLALDSQLEIVEATLPGLNQKRVQAQDLLSVLRGRLPAEGMIPDINFDTLSLPQQLPLTLPSSLVKDRPDILEAEAQLHAANAEIGVATAEMLPDITLGGSLGTSSIATAGLFTGPSALWSLGAGLAQPVFEGGTLWYRRQAAIDSHDASVADYQQTVLTAFQQVADTLRALEHDADTLAADDRALATSERSLKLSQADYATGLADYSQVLIADAQYRQARIADIQVKASRFQDTVALFAALGGGWWNAGNDALAAR
jgi:NodT family efflux transporter outer membrane factor (OMF) lipoprotein